MYASNHPFIRSDVKSNEKRKCNRVILFRLVSLKGTLRLECEKNWMQLTNKKNCFYQHYFKFLLFAINLYSMWNLREENKCSYLHIIKILLMAPFNCPTTFCNGFLAEKVQPTNGKDFFSVSEICLSHEILGPLLFLSDEVLWLFEKKTVFCLPHTTAIHGSGKELAWS